MVVVYKAASGKAVNRMASDWRWAHLNIRPALWLEVSPLWKTRVILQYKILPGGSPLNMFSVVGEQIRSLTSKQSKLNFWNQLHPKIAFLCRFWTQTATWQPNHTILTSSVKSILKAMIDTFFWRPSLTVGGFYNQREYFRADWLVLLLIKL